METDDIGAAFAEFTEAATARIEAAERAAEQAREQAAYLSVGARAPGRVTAPDEPGARFMASSRPTVPAEPRAPRALETGGFRHSGEFFAAVRSAGLQGAQPDGRLMAAAPSTWGNEGAGSEGGFAVPPDYRATILRKAFGEDSLISRCRRVVTASNTLTYPSAMTTPWDGTGVRAAWIGEGATLPKTRPELENLSLRLHKLAAFVVVTEELLEDGPAMGSLVAGQAAAAIDFELSRVIAYGSGAGQPLGFMNSPALVTTPAVSGQTADTITAENVLAMSARLPSQSRRSAVWLIHPDAEPQLHLMKIGDTPVYMPPGGLRDEPFGRLLGRPVIPHQVCQTVGDLGDIMLVDLAEYMVATKQGGMRAEASIHVHFDQDATAFRFVIRVGGQPWWSRPSAALNGSLAQSPFVTLAAR